MRKILLTSVGVAALAVSANATDFTLSGTAKVKVDDNGDTSVDVSTAVGVSKLLITVWFYLCQTTTWVMLEN